MKSMLESAKDREESGNDENEGNIHRPIADPPTASTLATALPSAPRSRSFSAAAKLPNHAETPTRLLIGDLRRADARKSDIEALDGGRDGDGNGDGEGSEGGRGRDDRSGEGVASENDGRLYIPVIQIWMEKMNEVKRPPL
ncbi:hypothetical protein GW17_00028315 [Ensete ventricosum]|nr:hypothetical protein GW17_00028315 [Ensete ventricosum]